MCLEHGNSSPKKSCSFKDRITVTCVSRTVRSSCRGSTQEGSTTPLPSPALYVCSVLNPPLFFLPRQPLLACTWLLGSEHLSRITVSTPNTSSRHGKESTAVEGRIHSGAFLHVEKRVPFVSCPWHQLCGLLASPLLASMVALVRPGGGGGWGTRISSGSVAEQQLQSGD